MEKSKIFIASSGRALGLARELKSALTSDYSDATIWFEVSQNKPSETIVEMIKQSSEDYDFAITILIKDDMFCKGGLDNVKQKAHDTLIFKAGMFMGVLERERCFLISSIDSADLPVDLEGFIYKKIVEPDDLGNKKQCKISIKDSADAILKIIEKKGNRFIAPTLKIELLSYKELFEREIPKSDMGDLEGGPVVYFINYLALDIKKKIAAHIAQINHNLKYGIEYFYFLSGEPFNARSIWNFLMMLLFIELSDENIKDIKASDSISLTMTKEKQTMILRNMKKLIDLDNMNFAFFPKESTFEFIIHNASDIYAAKSYLKYGERGFMEWVKGKEAARCWSNLRSLIPGISKGLFHSTVLFDFYGDQGRFLRESLEREIKRVFPEIFEEIRSLCFEK